MEIREYAVCVWVENKAGEAAPFWPQNIRAYTAEDAVTQARLKPELATWLQDGWALDVQPDPDGSIRARWQRLYNDMMRQGKVVA